MRKIRSSPRNFKKNPGGSILLRNSPIQVVHNLIPRLLVYLWAGTASICVRYIAKCSAGSLVGGYGELERYCYQAAKFSIPGKSPLAWTLDRHHDLRKNLINSSSQHLDGAIQQCFIAWDEAHGVNGEGSRLLEVYLPCIDSESYFSTYQLVVRVGKESIIYYSQHSLTSRHLQHDILVTA